MRAKKWKTGAIIPLVGHLRIPGSIQLFQHSLWSLLESTRRTEIQFENPHQSQGCRHTRRWVGIGQETTENSSYRLHEVWSLGYRHIQVL